MINTVKHTDLCFLRKEFKRTLICSKENLPGFKSPNLKYYLRTFKVLKRKLNNREPRVLKRRTKKSTTKNNMIAGKRKRKRVKIKCKHNKNERTWRVIEKLESKIISRKENKNRKLKKKKKK